MNICRRGLLLSLGRVAGQTRSLKSQSLGHQISGTRSTLARFSSNQATSTVPSSSGAVTGGLQLNEVSGVRKITWPGSRMLQFNDPEAGNRLNTTTIRELNKLLVECARSESVAVVFFGSGNTTVCSRGIDSEVLFNKTKSAAPLCRHIQTNAHFIHQYEKPTVAMLSGEVTGTALGLLGGCRYRLVSPSATLRLSELHHGQLPVAGLAHLMVRGCAEGAALARYLALTQRPVYGHELIAMGIATHAVGEHPHDTLAHAISQTIAGTRADLMKGRFTTPVDLTLLPELLDSMDVRDPDEDEVQDKYSGSSNNSSVNSFATAMTAADGTTPGGAWAVFEHPVWQQASLVPEQTLTTAQIDAIAGTPNTTTTTTTTTTAAAVDPTMMNLSGADICLTELLADIELCFNNVTNKTVQDTVGRLKALDTPWARAVLRLIDSSNAGDSSANSVVSRDLLQVWYSVTDGATRWSYEESLQAEFCATMNVIRSKLTSTPLDATTALKHMPAELPGFRTDEATPATGPNKGKRNQSERTLRHLDI